MQLKWLRDLSAYLVFRKCLEGFGSPFYEGVHLNKQTIKQKKKRRVKQPKIEVDDLDCG